MKCIICNNKLKSHSLISQSYIGCVHITRDHSGNADYYNHAINERIIYYSPYRISIYNNKISIDIFGTRYINSKPIINGFNIDDLTLCNFISKINQILIYYDLQDKIIEYTKPLYTPPPDQNYL